MHWFRALSLSTALLIPTVVQAGPPMLFEPNAGQAPAGARFVARHGASAVAVGAAGLTLSAVRGGQGVAVRVRLVGADAGATVRGEAPAQARVNYLLGRDRGAWRTGLPTYRSVRTHDAYPGIDLVTYGLPDGGLEHDFVLRPGADPRRIAFALEGAQYVRLRGAGLEVGTRLGSLTLRAPVAYQIAAGRRLPVAAAYRLTPARAGKPARVAFAVAAYDRSRALVIDPVVEYSTLIGAPTREVIEAIRVDAAGAMYVAVWTTSPLYPTTPGAFDLSKASGYDVAVSKLNAAGTQLVYSTFLGGNGDDEPLGMALDASGRALVCGSTLSTDFPVTGGAYQAANAGHSDGFLTRLTADGSALDFSTYWGAAQSDELTGIAVDPAGGLFACGNLQHLINGGLRLQANVLRFSPDGGSVEWQRQFSCELNSLATCIALGPDGDAYLGGWTNSDTFPATLGAFQEHYAGVSGFWEGIVARLDASGGVTWASFYGSTDYDVVTGIAVDSQGRPHICGYTRNGSAPTTPGAVRQVGADFDAFCSVFTADGASLVYGSILGGAKLDEALGIVVDSAGRSCITGRTRSSDFPTTADAIKPTNTANIDDAFLVRYNASGSALEFASYLGGAGADQAYCITMDAAGKLLIAGATTSRPFPTTPACFSSTNQGNGDGFIMRVNMGLVPSLMYVPDRTGRLAQAVYLRGYLRNGVDRAWLPGRTLEFAIDGVALGTGVTDAAGHAMLPIVATHAVGDHSLTVAFTGDGSFAGSSAEAPYRVRAGASVLWGIDRAAASGGLTYLRGYLRRLPDYAWLAGRTLVFSIDGAEVGQAVTTAAGCGSYLYAVPAGMASGGHAILAEFRGDIEYDASSFASTLTVP